MHPRIHSPTHQPTYPSPPPHGASRLVHGLPAWSVKTRRVAYRHRRVARVKSFMTAMHEMSTPLPPPLQNHPPIRPHTHPPAYPSFHTHPLTHSPTHLSPRSGPTTSPPPTPHPSTLHRCYRLSCSRGGSLLVWRLTVRNAPPTN